MVTPAYKHRSWSKPSPPPLQEKPAQVPPPAIPTPPPAPVAQPEATFEPRELTFAEVCRYLGIRPDIRRYFVNKQGEYVRSLVAAYRWTIDQEKRVHKIPNWFFNNETW